VNLKVQDYYPSGNVFSGIQREGGKEKELPLYSPEQAEDPTILSISDSHLFLDDFG
jgi:hypothetical protein